MNKKLVIWTFFMILLMMSAYAQIRVDAVPTYNNIFMDEQAVFKTTIRNLEGNAKTINIFTADLRWYIDVEPEVTTVSPNSEIQFDLMLVPNVWAQQGSHLVKVTIEDTTKNERVVVELPVFVKSYEYAQREYSPSIEVVVEFPEVVDPREDVPVDVYLRNRNKRDNKDLNLEISTSLFMEKKPFLLGPLGETSEKFLFEIDDTTAAGKYELEVVLLSGNKTLNRQVLDYNILAYSDFQISQDSISSLFKETTDYTIVNVGNIRKSNTFRIEMGFLERLFTASSLKASRFDFGGQYLEWELELDPMEELTIRVVRNFRPMIYAILILIVIIMMYFIYRSPLTLKKESVVVGALTEGISEMKAIIHLRNRSPDIIDKIALTDLIPALGDYVDEKKVGTLLPTKVIKHHRKGTILRWDIEALEPFEERIISYRLKTKMTVIGGLSLPPARIKFITKKGTERIVKSNKFLVSLGL